MGTTWTKMPKPDYTGSGSASPIFISSFKFNNLKTVKTSSSNGHADGEGFPDNKSISAASASPSILLDMDMDQDLDTVTTVEPEIIDTMEYILDSLKMELETVTEDADRTSSEDKDILQHLLIGNCSERDHITLDLQSNCTSITEESSMAYCSERNTATLESNCNCTTRQDSENAMDFILGKHDKEDYQHQVMASNPTLSVVKIAPSTKDDLSLLTELAIAQDVELTMKFMLEDIHRYVATDEIGLEFELKTNNEIQLNKQEEENDRLIPNSCNNTGSSMVKIKLYDSNFSYEPDPEHKTQNEIEDPINFIDDELLKEDVEDTINFILDKIEQQESQEDEDALVTSISSRLPNVEFGVNAPNSKEENSLLPAKCTLTIQELNSELTKKKEVLRKLKLVKLYKSKWDKDELKDHVQNWKEVAQNVLLELQHRMKNVHGNVSMENMLRNYGIDPEFIGYDAEEDSFN